MFDDDHDDGFGLWIFLSNHELMAIIIIVALIAVGEMVGEWIGLIPDGTAVGFIKWFFSWFI